MSLKQLRLADKSLAQQRQVVSELNSIIKDIERCERTITELTGELYTVTVIAPPVSTTPALVELPAEDTSAELEELTVSSLHEISLSRLHLAMGGWRNATTYPECWRHDIATDGRDLGERLIRAFAEDNNGEVATDVLFHEPHYLCNVFERKFFEVVGRKRSCPGVEYLHNVCTGFYLRDQVLRDDVSKFSKH